MYLRTELRDSIAVVTLTRPQVHNALSWELLAELQRAFADLRERSQVRCVVLTGEGPSFASGGDIKEVGAIGGPEEAGGRATWCQEVFAQIETHPVPVVAAIHGHCLGGGCELAISTDIRVAHPQAKFGVPHVKMGIPPGYGATYRLPRLVGLGMAKYLILTGNIIDAPTALRVGLVDVLAPEDALETALEVAQTIASRAPTAVRLAKQALQEATSGQEDECARETGYFRQAFDTVDRLEAVEAFVTKRTPVFTGR